jgi:hypothetical protein
MTEEKGNESASGAVPTNTLALLDGLVSRETMHKIEEITPKGPDAKTFEKEEVSEEKPEVKEKPEEKKVVAEEKPEEKEAEGEEQEEEKPVKKEIDIKPNKFGVKLGKDKKEKEGSLVIENEEQFLGAIKSQFGQELKDIKETPKFFETVKKWRADSQNSEKAVKERDNAVSLLENLPDDLLESVQQYYKGEDYRKAFVNNPKIDFSKPAEKQDKANLVNHYFPGKFIADDFEEETPSPALEIALEASTKQYNSEKVGRENLRAKEMDKATKRQELFKSSINSSVEHLRASFPGVLPDVEQDIQSTLTGGDLMSEFFNPDGSYKQDAAEKLMLARHGKEFMAQLMEVAAHLGETQANEDMLTRGADKPKPVKGKGKDNVRSEVKEAIEELMPGGLKNRKVF